MDCTLRVGMEMGEEGEAELEAAGAEGDDEPPTVPVSISAPLDCGSDAATRMGFSQTWSPSMDFGQTLESLSKKLERTATAEDVERTQNHLKTIEDRYTHQIQVQEQKDAAQDELLNMQFDALKRDLGTYVRTQDLEDQKQFVLSKLSSNDLDMKDAMRSISTSLRQEVSNDARKLQDQLEKVSQAVVQQIKLVDTRLKENAEADSLFENLVRERLSRVEKELGVGEFAGMSDRKERMEQLESRVEFLMEGIERLRRQQEADKQELMAVMKNKPTTVNVAPETVVEKKTLEHRITTLEDTVEEVVEKGKKTKAQVEELKVQVEEARKENPLDWLEERVGELARKRGGERVDVFKRLGEVTARLETLEKWREAEGERRHEDASPPPPQQPQAPTPVEVEAKPLKKPRSRGGSVSCRGPAKEVEDGPKVSYVNLFEDMERLRCIIECMEETMPLETRRAIRFFKGAAAGGGGKGFTNNRGDNDGEEGVLAREVFDLRSETEEQARKVQKCEQTVTHEHTNMLKALRGVERGQDQIKAKVDELWRQLPQVVAILSPLQVRLLAAEAAGEGTAEGGEAAGGPGLHVRSETAIEALKPLSSLVEATLQKALDKLQKDVVSTIMTMKGEVGSKADAEDLSSLRERVERWARSPSRPRPGSLASYRSAGASEAGERWPTRGSGRCKTAVPAGPGSSCHELCKRQCFPMAQSQSAGQLPALSKTR